VKKQRWNAQERAGRDEARGIRSHAAGRDTATRVRPATTAATGDSATVPRRDERLAGDA
jgi:hypothetical protein